MALTNIERYTVEIPRQGQFCTVRVGANARTFMTTKAELLASLSADPASAETRQSASGWLDLLATHGFAMKQAGKMTSYLILVPPMLRKLIYLQAGGGDPLRPEATFPHILFAFRFNGDVFDSSYEFSKCYIVQPDYGSKLRVDAPDQCLHYYPWGNVFTTGGICWGTTPVNTFKPTDPVHVTNTFFETPFNHHLWDQVRHADPRGPIPATATTPARPRDNVASLPRLIELSEGGILKWFGNYPTSVREVAQRY